MDSVFSWTRLLVALAFLGFGLACLGTRHMREEFARYGLPRWRLLIGTLEVCGALGLALSGVFPALLVPAAAGLCLLMLMGVLTRLRLRDTFAQMLPALVLLILNACLVVGGLSPADAA